MAQNIDSATSTQSNDQERRDYFDQKVQEVASAAAAELVAHWQAINPFEPDLQRKLAEWRDDFLAHVAEHRGVANKTPFAPGGWHGHRPYVEVTVRIDRRPSDPMI